MTQSTENNGREKRKNVEHFAHASYCHSSMCFSLSQSVNKTPIFLKLINVRCPHTIKFYISITLLIQFLFIADKIISSL